MVGIILIAGIIAIWSYAKKVLGVEQTRVSVPSVPLSSENMQSLRSEALLSMSFGKVLIVI